MAKKKKWKSEAAKAAAVWIRQKARDLDSDSFGMIATAIIEGAPITDKLPKGTKKIIRKRLAKMYGLLLDTDEENDTEEIPKIQRISQQEQVNA